MSGIWAIVLAAGESRRMGSPKMLLPYNGRTIIEQVIQNVINADIEKTVIVLGAHRKEIVKVTGRYDLMHCYNENYSMGMLSSVWCGLRSLPEDYGAVLIMPGDQPMIGTGEINRVIKAYRFSGKGIVMPVYRGSRGHPVIIDRRYRDEVLSLPGTMGLRALAGRHPDDTLETETDDPSILRDIDTRKDYLSEINKTNL